MQSSKEGSSSGFQDDESPASLSHPAADAPPPPPPHCCPAPPKPQQDPASSSSPLGGQTKGGIVHDGTHALTEAPSLSRAASEDCVRENSPRYTKRGSVLLPSGFEIPGAWSMAGVGTCIQVKHRTYGIHIAFDLGTSAGEVSGVDILLIWAKGWFLMVTSVA